MGFVISGDVDFYQRRSTSLECGTMQHCVLRPEQVTLLLQDQPPMSTLHLIAQRLK